MYPAPHHALAVVDARQVLLKLLPNLEVHDVVPKSAQRADDHMVALLHDLFVWLQQVGDFAQGDIDICRGAQTERGRQLARKLKRTVPKVEGPQGSASLLNKIWTQVGVPFSLSAVSAPSQSVPFSFLSSFFLFFFCNKVFCSYANPLKTRTSKPNPAFLMKIHVYSQLSDTTNEP